MENQATKILFPARNNLTFNFYMRNRNICLAVINGDNFSNSTVITYEYLDAMYSARKRH